MSAPDDKAKGASPKRSGLGLALLPLAAFAALAAVFAWQLSLDRDVSAVPSPLIGKAAPMAKLTPIAGLSGAMFEPEALKGRVTIVNVWASWCVPCREENGLLLQLQGRDDIVVAGINYKDKPEQAKAFLAQFGNPFDELGADVNGRAAIEWGVYGVPETFIVGRDGLIAYKQIGPLLPSSLESGGFVDALNAALAAQ